MQNLDSFDPAGLSASIIIIMVITEKRALTPISTYAKYSKVIVEVTPERIVRMRIIATRLTTARASLIAL